MKIQSFFRRHSLWLISATVVAIAIAGAVENFGMFGKARIQYATAPVTRGDIERTVVAAGIVQPSKYVDVGAQTSGKLKSLKIDIGDQVQKNQLLAEIDPVLADTALTAAKAALENVTAQHALKLAQLKLAKLQRFRNEKLFTMASSAISASDIDIAQANYAVAVADVASLAAQMKQATATIDTAKANLGYTKITAPMSGKVVSVSLLEGQTINSSQQAPSILRIADISTVTIKAQVSEADVVSVKPGQNVYFTILGDLRRWNGKVRQILPTPELINNVVFYDVMFDIPNPEGILKIQMTAQVFIILAQAKGVLLIPAAAIGNASEGDEIQIRVLNANGNTEQRMIKIGIKNEILAEVKDGLQELEQVVIKQITQKRNKTSALTARKGP